MAMLEIKDIHKHFTPMTDKPRFHTRAFPARHCSPVRSALHVLNGVD